MFATEETDVNAIEYFSLINFMEAVEGAESFDAKFGEIAARATITTTARYGMLQWIDADKGQYCRLDTLYDGEEGLYTPEYLEEIALSLTKAE